MKIYDPECVARERFERNHPVELTFAYKGDVWELRTHIPWFHGGSCAEIENTRTKEGLTLFDRKTSTGYARHARCPDLSAWGSEDFVALLEECYKPFSMKPRTRKEGNLGRFPGVSV